MASKFIAPKLNTMMGSAARAARPAVRSNFQAARSFSAMTPARPSTVTKTSRATSPLMNTAVTRNLLARNVAQVGRRQYSSEVANAMVQVSQNLGMGSAAIGLGGAGIGIGLVFASLLMAVARNPSMRGQLFSYAILGFAFVEAIGLFDLMVAMMCKYV